MKHRAESRSLVPAAVSADRRQMLLFAAGGASAFHFARAAGAQSTPDGGWGFADDKGVEINLSDFPERLAIDVNATAPLRNFGIEPVAVFGWNQDVITSYVGLAEALEHTTACLLASSVVTS